MTEIIIARFLDKMASCRGVKHVSGSVPGHRGQQFIDWLVNRSQKNEPDKKSKSAHSLITCSKSRDRNPTTQSPSYR